MTFIVCPACQGHGTQDVFAGGMTASEMREHGEDFMDDYAAGVYSKPCEMCHGRNVCTQDDVDEAERRAEDAYERWAESGYSNG